MIKEIKKLCFASPGKSVDAFCTPAPPEALLSEGQQAHIRQLDTDDSGSLSISFNRNSSETLKNEVIKANNTFNELSSLLLRFQANPSNNRDLDNALHNERAQYISKLQNRLFTNISLKIIKPSKKTAFTDEDFELAKRPLLLTGDYKHLMALTFIILDAAKKSPSREVQIRYLKACEDYLYHAIRMAAEIPDARDYDLKKIDQQIGWVKNKLQKVYDKDRTKLMDDPYFIATMGTPITQFAEKLSANKTLDIPVSVPASFLKQFNIQIDSNGELTIDGKALTQAQLNELNTDLQNYYNTTEKLFLRPSQFKDTLSSDLYPLVAVNAILDKATLEDDQFGGAFSYHLQDRKIKRTIFDTDTQDRISFRMQFKVDQLPQLLLNDPSRSIWKFDLESLKNGLPSRRIKGGVVLQKRVDQSVDWYSGDPHVHHEDWRTVRNMAQGLLQKRRVGSVADLSEKDKLALDLIDRHYESVNRKFQQYLEIGEEAFRSGEKNRDFMLGDLVDYVNVAKTLQQQGYYLTNVRLFAWMLENYEGIPYIIYGNHCYHGRKYPKTQSIRHFFDFTSKAKEAFLKLADMIAFPESGGDQLDGIQALWTRSVDHHQEHKGVIEFTLLIKRLFDELTADDIFELENDDFQHAQMQELGAYDFYTLSLGNGFRIGMIDTGPEDFQFFLAGRKTFPAPVRDAVVRGVDLYINQQHVQGKGPPPQLMIALKEEIKKSWEKHEWFILGGHYPPFFEGRGADGLQDNEDALRFPAALTIRLLMWYYRHDQKSTLRLYMGGHVHQYSETTFDIYLKKDEEPTFRAELGKILEEKNGEVFMEKIWVLSQEWDLKNRMKIDRVREEGSDGFPGSLVAKLNANQLKTPLTITDFALSGNIPGYLKVTTNNHHTGDVQVEPIIFRERVDGTMDIRSAKELKKFRQERWEEGFAWDPIMKKIMKPLHLPDKPTPTTGDKPTKSDLSRWDWFPLFYKDRNHFRLLSIDGLAEGGLLFQGNQGNYSGLFGDLRLGVEFQLPLESRSNGGPYSWYIYALDQMIFDDEGLTGNKIAIGGGINAGRISIGPMANIDTSTGIPGFGANIVLSPWSYRLPIIPNFCLGAGSDIQGNWWTSIGLCSATTYATYQLDMPQHPILEEPNY